MSASTSSSTSSRWCATTAPSNSPPKPGAGSTGRIKLPSARRRVGVAGRECQTSSSASSISDQRTEQIVQIGGGGGDLVFRRFGVGLLDKMVGKRFGEL